MTGLTPQQQRLRDQFEGLIGAAAPLLDLVLGVGDRISRVVEPEDHEYYPVRSGTEASMLRTSAAVNAGEAEVDAGNTAGGEPRDGRDTGA